jgi:hypothetical protein
VSILFLSEIFLIECIPYGTIFTKKTFLVGFVRWVFLRFFGWVFYCQPCQQDIRPGPGNIITTIPVGLCHRRIGTIGTGYHPQDGGAHPAPTGSVKHLDTEKSSGFIEEQKKHLKIVERDCLTRWI